MASRFKAAPKSVLSSIVSGVQLTAEQKAAVKENTGVDVEWLLFHRVAGTEAQTIQPNNLAVIRLTYCW